MDNFNIAVFGCWNEGCKENSGQRSVVQVLKKNEEKYKFMVILGDNYYADKKKIFENKNKDIELKVKQTSLFEAKTGFDCLNCVNLEKKLIMGNHDIQDSLDKNCSVLKSQLKLPWYDVKFPFAYDLYYLSKNDTWETILFIYLDTTVYDKKLTDDNSCYSNTIGKSYVQIRNEQNDFIRNTLKTTLTNQIYSIKNVIFFGHEPLLTYKEKEHVLKPSAINELLNLLFEEKNKYKNKNFYWICADFHIYQNTEIINNTNGNKINQWIFGTGGGELDNVVSKNYFDYLSYRVNVLPNVVFNSDNVDISKNFNSYGLDKFGYGEIAFDLCSVNHKFIMSDYLYQEKNKKHKKDKRDKIGEDNNFKQKYLKYKNKYLSLKNLFSDKKNNI